MSNQTTPQTAIVTGASRGIGRAIAVALGGRGDNVVINYRRNADAARQCEQLVKRAGGAARVVQADIACAADRDRLVKQAAAEFGPINLLVNNAGIAPAVRVDLLDTDEESFDGVLDANLKGTFFMCQLVANRMVMQVEKMERSGPHAMINIGSISAYTTSANRGEYCITKAAVAMTTKLFAARLAEHGIGVYEIRPGIIATDMTAGVKPKYDKLIFEDGITPIRRWGTPQDVAQAVLAIAEGRLPFSTGEVINVDGGFHLHRL